MSTLPETETCCGGTRNRIGCEYHDPALQPAAPTAPPAPAPRAGRPWSCTGNNDTCQTDNHGLAEHCRRCGADRATHTWRAPGVASPAPSPTSPVVVPADWVFLGLDDPDVLGADTPPDLIYATPDGTVVGVPQFVAMAKGDTHGRLVVTVLGGGCAAKSFD